MSRLSNLQDLEVWFLVGSQHLYGDDVLAQVEANGKAIATQLNQGLDLDCQLVYKSVITDATRASEILNQASSSDKCLGVIVWMHTFSPAKMWINGLKNLTKPLLHLHTQMESALPWSGIDMNYMNLHQSAHGDREFGFICTRLGLRRKVLVGHWSSEQLQNAISDWTRAALAVHDAHRLRIARLGDNMREVAVTEGNQVSAQIQFGFAVDGYGLGELVTWLDQVESAEVDALLDEYQATYQMYVERSHPSLVEAARIELGLRHFLSDRGCAAFTTTFENLHGLHQLPGIAVQRLMYDGFGFGAEGDWKTAALLRAIKVMCQGRPGGTSFMEDYTYHLPKGEETVLGAHMLEVCPSITRDQPICAVHPLSIGGKADPARLIFTGNSGTAVNVCLVQFDRDCVLIANEVEAIKPPHDLPHLPVARVMWKPKPDLQTAAERWIRAGGSHHTCYSQALSLAILKDWAEMTDTALEIIR